MNILNFIKKDLSIERVDIEEGFLLVRLMEAQKFIIEFSNGNITFIICDSIDFCDSRQTVFFNCNDYCLLRGRDSEIRNIRATKCSKMEYKKECIRLEELFV